jgi:hypothetical protein
MPALSPEQRELLSLFKGLTPQRQASLLDFARFLSRQEMDSADAAPVVQEAPQAPLDLPRPEQESVVAAIRRLSRNYPMLENGELLHQSAALMSAHVMQGRDAVSVIDELEALFAEAYRKQQTGTPE